MKTPELFSHSVNCQKISFKLHVQVISISKLVQTRDIWRNFTSPFIFIFFWNCEIISKGWKESLESNAGILRRLTVWKQVYWQRTLLVFVLLQPSWSGVMHWGVRLEDWINREREGEETKGTRSPPGGSPSLSLASGCFQFTHSRCF